MEQYVNTLETRKWGVSMGGCLPKKPLTFKSLVPYSPQTQTTEGKQRR